ncbi:hypothetical protein [Rheinheimera sp.]|uniref:hypothetical protein n=1 Tax=Rheinheimera sp. TaxID=1869214 RepID=UPI00307EF2F0
MRTGCRQKGIALFQVLLLSVILSLLAMFITQKVKQQTQAALRLTDKMQAMMQAKSAESELMALMLTQSIENYRRIPGWNIYGEFFSFKPGVQVSIQSMNGLITIGDNQVSERLLTQLISQTGLTQEPQTVSQSLLDFIDRDGTSRGSQTESNAFETALPNRWVQHSSELRYLKGMTTELLHVLNRYVNWQSLGSYNPSASPEHVLRLLFGDEITKEIQSLREKQVEYEFYSRRVAELTKLDDELGVSFAGPMYCIQIRSTAGDGFWAYQLVVFINKQNLKDPLLFLSRESVFQDV